MPGTNVFDQDGVEVSHFLVSVICEQCQGEITTAIVDGINGGMVEPYDNPGAVVSIPDLHCGGCLTVAQQKQEE